MGGVTFVVLAGAWACSSSEPVGTHLATGVCPGTELVVAAGDYRSSLVCGAPPCAGDQLAAGAALGGDVQLAASKGRIFLMARESERLFELDPACGTPIAQMSVKQPGPKQSNAHDVAVAKDGSLFVALYGVPRIIHLVDGREVEADAIDLARGYDDDGNPQAESIRIVEVGGAEKAFVTLERLDDASHLASRQSSLMLRIDVATRKVEARVELEGRNPFNPMVEHAGGLYLSEAGNFDDATDARAGIERFDVATSTTKLLVAEKDLGGSVSELAVTDGCGAAIVAGPQTGKNPTSLVTFDPVTGDVLTTAAAPVFGPTDGYDLSGLAWRGDLLYLGDRRRAGNGYPVRVFARDPGTCKLHDTGRSISLPLQSVTFRPAR
ncbi:MAG: hypothetical protein JWP97_12 [Labilithrix sp.]|nr:hypothetical protein [Labilithrix sp.]